MSHGAGAYAHLIPALLSPLASALLDPWRASVTRELVKATDAEVAFFSLVEEGAAPFLSTPAQGLADEDRDELMALAAQSATRDVITHNSTVAIFSSTGINGHGMLAVRRRDDAVWIEDARELMRTIRPAFQSGVDLRRRFGAGRAAFARVLDGLNQMLLLCDDAGRGLHENDALTRYQSEVSDGAMLAGSMEAFARSLALSRPWESEKGLPEASEREIRTPNGAFCLHGSYVAESVFGGGSAILIAADVQKASDVDPGRLADRFGLTPRQAETARFLAAGQSNAQIAERLGVSLFTVQKHVRQVLKKLGVNSRSKVGAALRDRDQESG